MKIALSIISALLLVVLIGVGVFFFMQNSAKNEVGSMMKDKELQACTILEQSSLEEKIEDGIKGLWEKFESGEIELEDVESEEEAIEMIHAKIDEILSDQYDTDTVYCMTEASVVVSSAKSQMTVILASLGNAREKALEAAAKSSIASTVPAVILCADKDGFINEPVPGKNICESDTSLGAWPDLSEYNAQWSGCGFEINKENATFKYCAQINGRVAACTETGCMF